MKKKLFALAALVAALGSTATTASAQDVLTGDTRLACEAILCLATGTRPSECAPSLRRYFSISHRRLSDTIRGRVNFLKLCPVANQTPQMQALVNAQANGAGRCDAQSLNATLVMWRGYDDGATYISNQMPDYCGAYMGHAYTDFNGTMPRYVGTPERGGYWVEARDYDRALAEYNERIRREDEERQRQSWMN
jgi:hypothetical protein